MCTATTPDLIPITYVLEEKKDEVVGGLGLPADIWNHIFAILSDHSIGNLELSCKEMYELTNMEWKKRNMEVNSYLPGKIFWWNFDKAKENDRKGAKWNYFLTKCNMQLIRHVTIKKGAPDNSWLDDHAKKYSLLENFPLYKEFIQTLLLKPFLPLSLINLFDRAVAITPPCEGSYTLIAMHSVLIDKTKDQFEKLKKAIETGNFWISDLLHLADHCNDEQKRSLVSLAEKGYWFNFGLRFRVKYKTINFSCSTQIL